MKYFVKFISFYTSILEPIFEVLSDNIHILKTTDINLGIIYLIIMYLNWKNLFIDKIPSKTW